MKKSELNLLLSNGLKEEVYSIRVEELIRKKYSLSNELSLGRQRDKKPEEWEAYDAYCEECKAQAKIDVYGGSAAWI